MIQSNLHEKLRPLKYFIDNEHLEKYCRLVEQNRLSRSYRGPTHKHHIIPRSWFKLVGYDVNNELNNLIKLSYREHVLAHYYLCLCTEYPFRHANQLALMCLLTRKTLNSVDRHLIKMLPLYNNIYEEYESKRKQNYKLYEEN